MIKNIKLLRIGILVSLSFILFNNSYALTTYKECSLNNGGYKSRILCDNNYYLYYNLQEIHSAVTELVKKYPMKGDEIKTNLLDILNSINQELFNNKTVCNYFFNKESCKWDKIDYSGIKSMSNIKFLNSLNIKGKLLTKNIIKKWLIKNMKDDNKVVMEYEKLENYMNNYKTNVNTFITSLGVILTKKWKFDFSNVIFWTNDINTRLIALSNPKLTKGYKNIKHYKIWLIKVFSPFFNMSSDIFWSLPLTWRYIANPYIIFWIIWYYLMYIWISLLIIFILLGAFLFPLIETEKKEWQASKMELKRRNIWQLMMNSQEFNFIAYVYKILLSNDDYEINNDTWIKVVIKNEYRVPFIIRSIISHEHVWLGYTLVIRIMLFWILSMLSGYLI